MLTFFSPPRLYQIELRGLGGMTPPMDRSSSPTPGYLSSNLLDEENDVSYSRSALQQSATLTSNDSAIQQREREITDLANGILELADIFKELQTMVIDQGTLLDRIDYNVERMATDVKQADKELIVASGYQKKTTKRKAILLLILCIVGLIILITLKPRKGSSAPAPAPAPAPPPPAEPKQPDKPKSGEDAAVPIPGDPGVGKGPKLRIRGQTWR